VEIREATIEDMRRFKCREHDSANIEFSFDMSEYRWVFGDMAIGGCLNGLFWVMFAEGITSLPLSFFKESMKLVKNMLDRYGMVEAFTEEDNTFVLEWAKSMGFSVSDPIITADGTFIRVWRCI